MPFGSHLSRRSTQSLLLLVLLATILALAPGLQAQEGPSLIVSVGDTIGSSGQLNSVITVRMTNFDDSVGAFTLWIRLNRPDIAEFQTELDTIVDTTYWKCLLGDYPDCDSEVSFVESLHTTYDTFYVDTVEAFVGNLDTVGTLISGWEYVQTRNIDAEGHDIRVTALANVQGDGFNTPGIEPQTNGILFRLLADILEVPDTLQDRTAILEIVTGAKQFFVYSRPNGSAIGYYNIEVPDSNMYRCLFWDGPDCLDWQRVSLPPYDSISYFNSMIAVLDTELVVANDGSITVLSGVCGNLNGDPEGNVDISDLTYMVNYLFLLGPPPDPLSIGNMNCDSEGAVDISDLTLLVNYLFLLGPPPCDVSFNGGC